MRIGLIFLLTISFLYAQDYKKWFDTNSFYRDRGDAMLEIYSGNDVDIDQTYNKYKRIEDRTIAINPRTILPGSVVFIPELSGVKLPDGRCHDGYFFAHDVLKNPSSEIIKIYDTNHIKIPTEKVRVFVVRGVMAKTMRTRFELKYSTSDEKPTYKMVAADFTRLMQKVNKEIHDPQKRFEFYSELGKGTPYLVYNLGEGAGSNIDPDPTIDFARTDCMTFCEHTLALTISGNYNEMYANLQKIRYKNGIISYTTRNHYTIVDWLPNNSWLLKDVTKKLGNGLTESMTKEIDRPAFYQNNGVPQDELKNAPQKKKLTIDYIPTGSILKIQNALQGGEIVSVITTHPAVFSAHMGIIIRDHWDNIIFRHASSREQTDEVMDERLSDYIDQMLPSKTRVGMLFMRIRDDYKIP